MREKTDPGSAEFDNPTNILTPMEELAIPLLLVDPATCMEGGVP